MVDKDKGKVNQYVCWSCNGWEELKFCFLIVKNKQNESKK